MPLAPSKKTNVLFLEKFAPSRVTRARVCREDSAQRKTKKKWRRKLPSLEMKKFRFCHQCHFQIWGKLLGRTFWIVTLNMRIVQVILMMAVCRRCVGHVGRGFPRSADKTFCGQKRRRTTIKQLKANQAGERKDISQIYFLWGRTEIEAGSRKDC